jgi:transcriptional regulator with XRE-family HTH domain
MMSSTSNKPIFTPGYVHIPNLRRKLEWLYARHHSIKSQNKLAAALGVSASTLSGWLTGTRRKDGYLLSEFFNPDSIPTKSYHAFVSLWGVPEDVLLIEDIAAFRDALSSSESGPSPWDNLMLSLPDDQGIEIVVNATRGIANPDNELDPDLPTLRIGEEILLRVNNPGMHHAVILLHDRSGWSCLRPTQKYPETATAGSIEFPTQTHRDRPKFARIQDPTGLHRILTVFTVKPLPSAVLNSLLSAPIDARDLNQAAGLIRQLIATSPDTCCLASRRFMVSG